MTVQSWMIGGIAQTRSHESQWAPTCLSKKVPAPPVDAELETRGVAEERFDIGVTSYFSEDEEIVTEAAGIWKRGSDLTTLFTIPHPPGISTIIQQTAIRSGEDFFSEVTMVKSLPLF